MRNLQEMPLSGLGAMVMDAYDEMITLEDNDVLDSACKEVAKEIVRRCNPDKVRPMMDYHYKLWADASAEKSDDRNGRFLEFKALMTAFIEINDPQS